MSRSRNSAKRFPLGRTGLSWLAIGAVGAASALVLWTNAFAEAPTEPKAGPAQTTTPPAEAASNTPSAKVRIVFKTVPPTKATVNWGKKKLGFIKPKAPLIIERPRDSGPIDVVIHAEGCLPVHSRVYTFTDSTLSVKVTPPDKKNTVFGYKEAPPEDENGEPTGTTPDGGVPK